MKKKRRSGRECENETAKRILDALGMTKFSDDEVTLDGQKATEFRRDIMMFRNDFCIGCQFILRLIVKFADDGHNEIYGMLRNDSEEDGAWLYAGCTKTERGEYYMFCNRISEIAENACDAMHMKLSEELWNVGE